MKKLIREHIYEKFIQDSDPIADMGIGMKHQIKKWIETETDYYAYEQDLLWICSMHGKAEFVKYLLDAGADVHAGNDYSLQIASNNGHIEVVKILLDAGTNVHAEDNCALRWAKQNRHKDVIKVLKDHIAKEKKNKTVKENLNEKFVEDSDPIADMDIGMKHIFKNFVKLFDKLESQKYIYTIKVNPNSLTLYFDNPKMIKLAKDEREKVFSYVVNIIKELKIRNVFNKISLKTEKTEYENDIIIMPRIIRLEIKEEFKKILEPAQYRRKGINREFLEHKYYNIK